ncbi:hypothetical protein [Halovenus salina]|uniref:Transposase DDE domain-containing protein n=1 Tax=Halovenus salina TaxID=1510225 RepID=A0ABD5W4T9_9EURY
MYARPVLPSDGRRCHRLPRSAPGVESADLRGETGAVQVYTARLVDGPENVRLITTVSDAAPQDQTAVRDRLDTWEALDTHHGISTVYEQETSHGRGSRPPRQELPSLRPPRCQSNRRGQSSATWPKPSGTQPPATLRVLSRQPTCALPKTARHSTGQQEPPTATRLFSSAGWRTTR